MVSSLAVYSFDQIEIEICNDVVKFPRLKTCLK